MTVPVFIFEIITSWVYSAGPFMSKKADLLPYATMVFFLTPRTPSNQFLIPRLPIRLALLHLSYDRVVNPTFRCPQHQLLELCLYSHHRIRKQYAVASIHGKNTPTAAPRLAREADQESMYHFVGQSADNSISSLWLSFVYGTINLDLILEGNILASNS